MADYADFLARTGAESGKASAYDAFLVRTGAKLDAVDTTPNADAGLNEYGLTGEPGEFAGKGVEVGVPIANILAAAGRGASAGFGDPGNQPNPVLSEQAQAALDAIQRAGGIKGRLAQLGSTVAGDVGGGINYLKGAGGALVGAYQGGVSQAGVEIGQPLLGRDLAALPEAFPTGDLSGGTRIAAPKGGGEPNALAVAKPAAIAQETRAFGAPLSDLYSRFQAEPAAAAEPAEAAASPVPSMQVIPGHALEGDEPGAAAHGEAALPPAIKVWLSGLKSDVDEVVAANKAAGVPGSLSAAATPDDLAGLTAEQTKAYRRQSELGEILRPPEVGEDREIYVPGSTPTLAEYSGNAKTAQAENVVRQKNPDAFTGPDGQLTLNNTARVRSFDDLAGSDPQIAAINDRLRAAASRDTTDVMNHARDVDLEPVRDVFREILDDPRLSERDAVRRVLEPLEARLYEGPGGRTLKTDPRAVWGMHDNLMDKLEDAKLDTKAERFVTGQLVAVKDALDDAMNKATDDHFQTFLNNQATLLQERNGLQVLQKFRPQLTNAKGDIRADAFHRWLVGISVRRGLPGVDPAMDIPDGMMRGLINLDKDLKRASNIDLGKARGSPTALYLTVANALGLGGMGLAHSLVAAAGQAHGGVGNIILQRSMNAAKDKVGSLRINALTNKHLAPPPGGFTYNALSDQD